MKQLTYVARWLLALGAVTGGPVLAHVGDAVADVSTPPDRSFCTNLINGTWLDNESPSNLLLALPMTVSSASYVLPYYQDFLRNLAAARSDYEVAQKVAPNESLHLSLRRVTSSFAKESSYVEEAASTVTRLMKTKNANLVPVVTKALTYANSIALPAFAPLGSGNGGQIQLCTPWSTAFTPTEEVAADLASGSRQAKEGLTTLSELQSAMRRHAPALHLVAVGWQTRGGGLATATLSVTLPLFRIYTCLRFNETVPHDVIPSICPHQYARVSLIG